MTILLFASAPKAYGIDVIAHRGNSCGAIENSNGAIRGSWSVGSDAVELDVRVSKDDVVYLFHDDEINDLPVSNMEYAEIRRRAGPWAGETLVSALETADPGGYYILDLKNPGDGNYRRVVQAVRESRIAQHKVTFQSESVVVLSAIKQKLPGSRYFFLTRLERRLPFFLPPNPKKILKDLTGHNIEGISIKGRSFVDQRFVEILHTGGLLVHVWTINDATRARYYKSIGVDGIITDNTAGFLQALGKHQPAKGACRANEQASRRSP